MVNASQERPKHKPQMQAKRDPNISHFYDYIHYIVLHLARLIQDILFYFYLYIFEKKYRWLESRHSNPPIMLILLLLWTPKIRSQRASIRRRHIYSSTSPFEDSDIGEKTTERLQTTKICSSEKKVPQGKHLYFFAPHDSKAIMLMTPSSSRCEKDEKDTREAIRDRGTSSSETETCKIYKKVMISHPL